MWGSSSLLLRENLRVLSSFPVWFTVPGVGGFFLVHLMCRSHLASLWGGFSGEIDPYIGVDLVCPHKVVCLGSSYVTILNWNLLNSLIFVSVGFNLRPKLFCTIISTLILLSVILMNVGKHSVK